MNEWQQRRLEQGRRKADGTRVGFAMTGLRLCFVPAPVSSIAVDDPRRTRCVSIVQHNLKTVVLIRGVLVRPITEEAYRIIFLALTIGHAREPSIFLALRTINNPIKIIIYSRTAIML